MADYEEWLREIEEGLEVGEELARRANATSFSYDVDRAREALRAVRARLLALPDDTEET